MLVTSQVRKLRLDEVKYLVLRHTAGRAGAGVQIHVLSTTRSAAARLAGDQGGFVLILSYSRGQHVG